MGAREEPAAHDSPSEKPVGGTAISHYSVNPLRYQYAEAAGKPVQEVLVRPKDKLNTLLKSELRKSQQQAVPAANGAFLQKVETNVLNMKRVWQAQRKKAPAEVTGVPLLRSSKNAP